MARRPPRDARARAKRTDSASTGAAPPASPPELVVVTRPESAMRASAGRFAALWVSRPTRLRSCWRTMAPPCIRSSVRPKSGYGTPGGAMSAAAQDHGRWMGSVRLLQGRGARRTHRRAASAAAEQELVESAYVKPPAEPAVNQRMAPAPEEPPPATPDFTPGRSISTRRPAASMRAGRGRRPAGGARDIRIIDIEGAWRFTHEDLTQNQGGVVGGTQSPASTGATTARRSSASTAAT